MSRAQETRCFQSCRGATWAPRATSSTADTSMGSGASSSIVATWGRSTRGTRTAVLPDTMAIRQSGDDPQKVLPTLVLEKMPFIMQVLFFGALLSAIKSCASATLLAPSVTFVENIWRQFRPHMGDQQELKTMRITVLVFSALVLCYAIWMQGSSIYEMVSGAYQVTLVGAFVPLAFGLYWARATTQGALFAIVLGLLTWMLLLLTPAGEVFPAQLGGVLASLAGMLIGSLGPQAIRNQHGTHHRNAGLG